MFAPDSAHWYQRDGVPLHSVPRANGGGLRPTTLRDARKLGLYPSVTNILNVIAKPELTLWLQEQVVLAALTLPRRPGEGETEFATRVVTDSQSARDSAADFGSAYHAGAASIARGGEVSPGNPAAEWLGKYREWLRRESHKVRWVERVLVHRSLGYAGTADLLMDHRQHGLTLVDIKTTRIRGAKPPAYSGWGYQLAAYRMALAAESDPGPTRCMSIVVDSLAPCEPQEYLWPEERMSLACEAVRAALTLWTIERQYDPSTGQTVRGRHVA